jgi:hypothetical protein
MAQQEFQGEVGSSFARLVVNAARYRASVVGWTGDSTKKSCSSSAETMGPRLSSKQTAIGEPPKRSRNLSAQA